MSEPNPKPELPAHLNVAEIEARLKRETEAADAAEREAKAANERHKDATANADALKLLLRLVRAYASGGKMPTDLRAYY